MEGEQDRASHGEVVAAPSAFLLGRRQALGGVAPPALLPGQPSLGRGALIGPHRQVGGLISGREFLEEPAGLAQVPPLQEQPRLDRVHPYRHDRNPVTDLGADPDKDGLGVIGAPLDQVEHAFPYPRRRAVPGPRPLGRPFDGLVRLNGRAEMRCAPQRIRLRNGKTVGPSEPGVLPVRLGRHLPGPIKAKRGVGQRVASPALGLRVALVAGDLQGPATEDKGPFAVAAEPRDERGLGDQHRPRIGLAALLKVSDLVVGDDYRPRRPNRSKTNGGRRCPPARPAPGLREPVAASSGHAPEGRARSSVRHERDRR